jgi:hypothetical protein
VKASNARFAFGEVPATVAVVSKYEEGEGEGLKVQRNPPRISGLIATMAIRRAFSWTDALRCTS